MDPSVVTGWVDAIPAALVQILFLVGAYRWGRRNGKKSPNPPKMAQALCSCTHGYGSHEENKQCRGVVKRADRWDTFNSPCHWRYDPCSCVRYDGPDLEMLRLQRGA